MKALGYLAWWACVCVAAWHIAAAPFKAELASVNASLVHAGVAVLSCRAELHQCERNLMTLAAPQPPTVTAAALIQPCDPPEEEILPRG